MSKKAFYNYQQLMGTMPEPRNLPALKRWLEATRGVYQYFQKRVIEQERSRRTYFTETCGDLIKVCHNAILRANTYESNFAIGLDSEASKDNPELQPAPVAEAS
jgi:hypothetical protein